MISPLNFCHLQFHQRRTSTDDRPDNLKMKREIWLNEQSDNIKFTTKIESLDWNALLFELNDVDEMCEDLQVHFFK